MSNEIEVNTIDFAKSQALDDKSFVRSGRRRMKCWDDNCDDVLFSEDPKGFTMVKAAAEFKHVTIKADNNDGFYWMSVLVFGPRNKDGKLNILVLKVGRVDKELNPIPINKDENPSSLLNGMLDGMTVIH